MNLRTAYAAAKAQLLVSWRVVEDMTFLLVMPLQTLVSLAVLQEAGHTDLAGYALTSSLLFTVGQMGFFVSSELVASDRRREVLELLVVTPTSYLSILWPRVLVMTSLGLAGFLESWLIAKFVFDIHVRIDHPNVLLLTLVATVVAGAGTAILTAALFSLARTVRTLQNAVNGPFYLLGGVLTPVSYLPIWLQPLSPFVFFYWSANLVRDSMQPIAIQNVFPRLLAILGLGLVSSVIGGSVLRRMLDQLRLEGRLGLS